MSDGHAPLVHGYVSGDPETGWRLLSNRGASRRDLPEGGHLDVGLGGGGYRWRHVPASGEAEATPFVGCAPTVQQARLDADQHARRCPL